MDSLKQEIEKLKKEIQLLKTKRVTVEQITPNVLKVAHFGEGNPWFYAGLEANLPKGSIVTSSVSCYFATDTNKLYIWNGSAWKSTTLS